MRRAALLALALSACTVSSPAGDGGDDVPAPDAGVDPGAPDAAPDPGPDAAPDPGDGVAWFTWPSQQNLSDATWGAALTDVANHLPASYGDTYWFDGDGMTSSHETSHGIHAHLRNHEAPSSIGWNALYVLHDRAAFVEEPDIRKQDIVPFVPVALRGSRFQLYLIEQTAWDDTPLYVFDEWNAYVNGAEVAIDQATHGLYDDGWTDAVMGPLEFVVYAIATCAATADGDPVYWATATQLKAFTAWNIRRAMDLYAAGSTMTEFAWETQDAYAAALRTGGAAGVADLRAFARATWGEAWTAEVLGF